MDTQGGAVTIQTDLYDYVHDFIRLESGYEQCAVALSLAGPAVQAPYIEITMIRHERTKTTGVTSGVYRTEFEIECWHTNTMKAEEMAALVSGLLQDYAGEMGTTQITGTRIYNEFSGADSDAESFYRSFTVLFTHE